MGHRRLGSATLLLGAVVALGACSPAPTLPTPDPSPTATTSSPETTTPAPPSPATTSMAPASTAAPIPTREPEPSPEPEPTPSAAPFDPLAAFDTIEYLAGLGPREATSPAFNEASAWVTERFQELGYGVTVEEFDVPAGNSWGVRVGAGTSHNLIADPPGFDPLAPHLVIGAHLDSVPQSPGAEDNASGVAVMLELARMVSEDPVGLPVRFIAFGAEEPRGEGDTLHHFGSQHHVAALGDAGRAAVVAMVALDRVGVPGDAVPVGAGGRGTTEVRAQLVAAAGDIPTVVREPNRVSDHWSYDLTFITEP